MSTPSIPTTAAKAWVAAAGTVLTAVTAGFAAVQLAVEDGALSGDEIGSVVATLAAVAVTVYGVWKTKNKPKSAGFEIGRSPYTDRPEEDLL